jgi:hypothetical protein
MGNVAMTVALKYSLSLNVLIDSSDIITDHLSMSVNDILVGTKNHTQQLQYLPSISITNTTTTATTTATNHCCRIKLWVLCETQFYTTVWHFLYMEETKAMQIKQV